MGTDIRGWVEVKRYSHWYGIIKIDGLLDRDYDMFACLFGVRNFAGFVPVVEERGLPVDSSDEVKEDESQTDSHSHTWITWEEILKIDWGEPTVRLDERVHYYQLNENGKWVLFKKAASGYPPQIKLDHEQAVQIGDTLYKVEYIIRQDILMPDWECLFEMMKMLAGRFETKDVRLVVWFDS